MLAFIKGYELECKDHISFIVIYMYILRSLYNYNGKQRKQTFARVPSHSQLLVFGNYFA